MNTINGATLLHRMLLLGASLVLLAAQHGALASTFSSPSSGVKVFVGSDADADYIELSAANSNGISMNSFSRFDLVGKKLRILHGGYQSPSYTPAKLVVIAAPDISLSSQIELVGEPADLIFIDTSSSGSAVVKCTTCGFRNFGRVTLAAASSQYSFTAGMTRLGKLSTFSGGSVNINGLDAAGVQSIEVIGERVFTAGLINTQIRGEIDSAGAYLVTPQGSKTIGNGGVNIYTGTTSVVYENLEVSAGAGTVYTGSCDLGGTLKSAMINIIASCPLNIASGAVLSTTSDALATGTHNGALVGVQEGIYLQTNRPSSSIHINGLLLSDNVVQAVSVGDLAVTKEVKANQVLMFAEKGLKVGGGSTVVADIVTAGSDWFSNQGTIQARSVEIEANQTLYNHFGGQIKGGSVKLVSNTSAVVNGSRTDKAYMPASLPAVPLTSQLKGDDRYGLYHLVLGETGSVKSNLAAGISANTIQIKAARFENINPYGMVKPDNIRWDQGVDLEVAKSRRVLVQAEKKLEIDAPEYVLNSSAIIGVNQTGALDINTALFMNQRYRVDAELGIFSRISYDSRGGVPTSSRSNVAGIETYITAYSPPGVIYTFGELTYSNGVQSNAVDSEFVNQFSFLEVLADANFHEAALQSIGLVMPIRSGVGHQPVRCAAYGCASATYKSLIEFETLTSFSGNVYGLSSDLLVQTVNQLEDGNKQALIDDFVDQRKQELSYEKTHINPTGVGGDVFDKRYVSKVEVVTDGNSGRDFVNITINQCTTIKYYNSGQTQTCTTGLEKHSVDGILSAAAGSNLVNGLLWTGDQIAEKARSYLVGQSRSGSLAVSGYPSVSGRYEKTYAGFSITDDNLFIVINYDEKFLPTSQAGLSEAQSRAAGYYAVTGSITVKLNDLMGAAPSDLPIPTGLALVSTSVREGSADVNLRWNVVAGQNFTYKLNGANAGTATTYTYPVKGAGAKSLNFRVQACNSIGCGDPSAPLVVNLVIQPTSSDIQSCSTLFFRPFTNQYRTTPTASNEYGKYGNYCGIKTISGVTYLAIGGQYQRFYAPGAPYTVCSNIKLFDRQALINAIVAGTTNYPAYKTSSEHQGECTGALGTGVTQMDW